MGVGMYKPLFKDPPLSAYRFTQVRWKVYPKTYMDPTMNREELAKPLPELDERRFRPIKAAKVDQTTSVFYDPYVK